MSKEGETAVDCDVWSATHVLNEGCQCCEAVYWEKGSHCDGVELCSNEVYCLCRHQQQLLIDADT